MFSLQREKASGERRASSAGVKKKALTKKTKRDGGNDAGMFFGGKSAFPLSSRVKQLVHVVRKSPSRAFVYLPICILRGTTARRRVPLDVEVQYRGEIGRAGRTALQSGMAMGHVNKLE